MSVHNHDEEIIKNLRRQSEADNGSLQAKRTKQEEEDILHDFKMLERLTKYEITEKHMKMVYHIINKVPAENKDAIMKNYIQGLIAAAVMDYENIYVRKRTDIKTWFKD